MGSYTRINTLAAISRYWVVKNAYTKRQIAPAWFLVALSRIWSKGPAEEEIISSMLPGTKRRTMRKIAPVNVPMQTQ